MNKTFLKSVFSFLLLIVLFNIIGSSIHTYSDLIKSPTTTEKKEAETEVETEIENDKLNFIVLFRAAINTHLDLIALHTPPTFINTSFHRHGWSVPIYLDDCVLLI